MGAAQRQQRFFGFDPTSPDLEACIQRESLEKERLRRQKALTAGTKMANHHEST